MQTSVSVRILRIPSFVYISYLLLLSVPQTEVMSNRILQYYILKYYLKYSSSTFTSHNYISLHPLIIGELSLGALINRIHVFCCLDLYFSLH